MGKAALLLALLAGAPALGDAALSQTHQTRLEHLVIQDCGSCHGMNLTGGWAVQSRPRR